MACSRCDADDHNVRTCDLTEEEVMDSGYRSSCDADCLYERSGNYCPECHRGD